MDARDYLFDAIAWDMALHDDLDEDFERRYVARVLKCYEGLDVKQLQGCDRATAVRLIDQWAAAKAKASLDRN